MKADLYNDFWRGIEELLIINDSNLKELSMQVGVPYTTLYYQYKNKKKPDMKLVFSLADNYDITPQQVLEGGVVGWKDPDCNYDSGKVLKAIQKAEIANAVKEGIENINELKNFDTSKQPIESGMLTIPFVSQTISAGYGKELLNPEDIEIQTVNIMEDLARGVPRESLLAARVKGDSMIDVYIYPDDIVVFAKGIISGDGIYVLSIDNEVMVKRLVFDRLNHTVLIISENKKYPQREAKDDNQSLRIMGKVVGWIHANSV